MFGTLHPGTAYPFSVKRAGKGRLRPQWSVFILAAAFVILESATAAHAVATHVQYRYDAQCQRAAISIYTEQQAKFDALFKEHSDMMDVWGNKAKNLLVTLQNSNNVVLGRFGDPSALKSTPFLPSSAASRLADRIEAATRAKVQQRQMIRQQRQRDASNIDLWCDEVHADVAITSLGWMARDAKVQVLMFHAMETYMNTRLQIASAVSATVYREELAKLMGILQDTHNRADKPSWSKLIDFFLEY